MSRPETACPACHMDESLKPVPATPSTVAFAICTSCEIRVELVSVPASPKPQPATSATATISQQDFLALVARVDGHDQVLAELAALRKELASVNKQNATLRAELAALKATPAQQQQQTRQTLPRQQQVPRQPPTVAPATQTPITAPITATWAQRAASGTKKKPNARQIAASARAFIPATGPQGFDFVYLPKTRKYQRSEIRSRLRDVGIDTSRVLDIIYPARDVIGLLVHVQYRALLKETLLQKKIETIDSFDPLDPKHIADPRHAPLGTEDRRRLAVDLHRQRLLHGLEKMRPHVSPAVARSYVEIGWIADTDVPQRNTPRHKDAGAAFRKEDTSHKEDALLHKETIDVMSEDSEDDECSLPTSWDQHHNYALPVIDPRDARRRNRGQYGITTLISPTCPFPVLPLPSSSPFISSFRIGTTHIVCCYIPPTLGGPDDSAAYNDILNSIPLLPDTIICGDFNARLGDITGDSITTTRGRILTTWMEDRQLLLWQTPAIFGVPTFCTSRGGEVHQSVIDLFLSNFPADITEMTVRTDLSLSSDHRLVMAALSLPDMVDDTSRPPGRRMWNLSRLQEDEVSALYVRAFSSASQALRVRLLAHLDQPQLGRPDIDGLAEELNELIYSALSRSVGDKKPRPKHWKWFWTPALMDAAAARDYCYRRWNRAVGLDKIPWWERYLTALHAFRLGVKRARRQAYRAFCDALERNFAAATSKIKAIRRRRQTQPTYCHPDGPMVAVETMSQQLASVSDGRFLPADRPIAPELPPGPHGLDESPFTIDSVGAAIRRLPNRKAPGADHLRAEMLKPI
ncbi:hypothetical protein INT43_001785, partial [Umbelopsis isabellina]